MKQNDQIRARLIDFIRENFLLGEQSTDLQQVSSLVEEGIIDSTGVMEIVGFIEEEFGIEIADEEIIPENLDSIDSLVTFIEQKKT